MLLRLLEKGMGVGKRVEMSKEDLARIEEEAKAWEDDFVEVVDFHLSGSESGCRCWGVAAVVVVVVVQRESRGTSTVAGENETLGGCLVVPRVGKRIRET